MQLRRRRASRSPLVLVVLVILVGGVLVARTLLDWRQAPAGPQAAAGTPAAQAPAQPAAAGTAGPARPATPTVNPTRPEEVARQFLALWEKADYGAMYDMLAGEARGRIARDAFVRRHQAITAEATILRVGLALGTIEGLPADAASVVIPFVATYETARIGRIEERRTLTLVREAGSWRVQWTPAVIFEGLTDATFVRMLPQDPVRGGIYDRTGQPLAIQSAVLAIGLQPGLIQNEEQFLRTVSAYLGWPPERLKGTYANAQPDWWVPLVELPLSRREEAAQRLGSTPGVILREVPARVYPQGPVASHVVGYLGHPTAEDAAKLRERGIGEEDWIGRAGAEGMLEDVIAGQRGGRLAIVDRNESPLRRIAEREAKPGADVHLTLDLNAQRLAEQVLGERRGSIVLMDPRDNSVLALASWPRFDPNQFILGFSAEEWQRLSQDPNQPFLNRATIGAYPIGSIFKVITMAAGMERAGLRPDMPFECRGTWAGYGPQQVFHDWLPQGHGRLTLFEGLPQSCNIVFYEVSKTLNDRDPNLLPEFARAFGLGEPTGIRGIEESPGTVPDPAWKRRTTGQDWFGGDAANLGIGQGFLTATPLQVANIFSALANDGVLRAPLFVRRIVPKDGGTPQELNAPERRRLPLSQATLDTIRAALRETAATPKGTAYYAFRGFAIPVAAKTGSAEFGAQVPAGRQGLDSHAWFAGYAPADRPELVVVVMVEGGGAGSQAAAPLARQVIERYFQPPPPGRR
jgi:penicillin-binding protein 2